MASCVVPGIWMDAIPNNLASDVHMYLQAERLRGGCLDQIGPMQKGLPVPVLLVADIDIGPPLLWCSEL
ncbi:hypothetical protein N7467_007121 [Penicillium canescens]|nr:hypothetical protein N7467_007121 [Penicillium canescens]